MIALLVGFLAAITTVVYCLVAWYLSALWSINIGDSALVSTFSVYTIKPLFPNSEYAMIHWQLLAIISLVGNFLWAGKLLKASGEIQQIALPFGVHTCLLLFALLAHIAGGLIPFIAVAQVLA
jgi:hypothetical protein